jgi:hypothetical protein
MLTLLTPASPAHAHQTYRLRERSPGGGFGIDDGDRLTGLRAVWAIPSPTIPALDHYDIDWIAKVGHDVSTGSPLGA